MKKYSREEWSNIVIDLNLVDRILPNVKSSVNRIVILTIKKYTEGRSN